MKFIQKNLLFTTALVLLSQLSLAKTEVDLNLVRALAPENYDIATYQKFILRGETEDIAVEGARSNIIFQDINNDQFEDLVVIFEQNPSIINYSTNEPCEKIDYEKGCDLSYGPRILNIYLGNKEGKLNLTLSKVGYVLQADEGGVFGDPLVGLSINSKKSFTVTFYGGSNWRWGYSDTIQFRNKNFYVIGADTNNGFTGDGSYNEKSINFITGTVIEKIQKNGDTPVKTIKSKIKVKPLVKFADYVNEGAN